MYMLYMLSVLLNASVVQQPVLLTDTARSRRARRALVTREELDGWQESAIKRHTGLVGVK